MLYSSPLTYFTTFGCVLLERQFATSKILEMKDVCNVSGRKRSVLWQFLFSGGRLKLKYFESCFTKNSCVTHSSHMTAAEMIWRHPPLTGLVPSPHLFFCQEYNRFVVGSRRLHRFSLSRKSKFLQIPGERMLRHLHVHYVFATCVLFVSKRTAGASWRDRSVRRLRGGRMGCEGIVRGVPVSCQDTDLFKEAIDEAQHRDSGTFTSVSWAGGSLYRQWLYSNCSGWWFPTVFFAGGEGLCSCGAHCESPPALGVTVSHWRLSKASFSLFGTTPYAWNCFMLVRIRGVNLIFTV